jgi:pimeloyl-ACP methyl ester carboxylesterase
MERPVIIAVAFGTTIAANYAIQYPERVKGVVLAAWSEMHEAMQYFQRWEKYKRAGGGCPGKPGQGGADLAVAR